MWKQKYSRNLNFLLIFLKNVFLKYSIGKHHKIHLINQTSKITTLNLIEKKIKIFLKKCNKLN